MGSAMRGLALGVAVALLAAGAGGPALAQTGTATTAPTTTKPATTRDAPAPPATKARVTSKSADSRDAPATPAKSAAPKPAAPAKPAAPSAPPKPVTPAKPAVSAVPPKDAAGPPAAKPAAPPPQQAIPLRDATPAVTPLPGAPAPVGAPGTSFRQTHPLLGAFLTGLLGVGLADSLIGEGAAGPDMVSDAKAGNLLEPVAAGLDTAESAGRIARLLLLGALIALVVVAWRRSTAAGPSRQARHRRRSAPALPGLDDVGPDHDEPVLEPVTHPEALDAIADEQDFADILLVVQAGWSEGSVMAMRGHITPDMATWFDRRLAQNVENGVENRVVDVANVRVERLADWEESGLHFARARMRWRAIDYVIDMAKLPDEPGYIIDGSPEEPVECEEVWTFVKSPDGAWVLCEIESAR